MKRRSDLLSVVTWVRLSKEMVHKLDALATSETRRLGINVCRSDVIRRMLSEKLTSDTVSKT